MVNILRRIAESECARLGIENPPLFFGQVDSPRVRYMPMQRLLLREDRFLARNGVSRRVSRTLWKAHLACYRIFLKQLRRDVRQSRRNTSSAMAAARDWEFRSFLSKLAISESSLLYLSCLGWKARLGFSVDTGAVRDLLDSLLVGAISPLEASRPS
jgi:hypothetical protein